MKTEIEIEKSDRDAANMSRKENEICTNILILKDSLKWEILR